MPDLPVELDQDVFPIRQDKNGASSLQKQFFFGYFLQEVSENFEEVARDLVLFELVFFTK